jgi:RimJ/RimL family protein N-acetyltransferase
VGIIIEKILRFLIKIWKIGRVNFYEIARHRVISYSMKILETERLILREVDKDDDAFMLDLLNQPSFIKYIGDRNVRNLEQSRDFIENRYRASYRDNGFGLYAVELKENQTPIGICGFVRRDTLPDADIGFAFLPQFERKGYAFESAAAIMDYGRKVLGLKRVLAITSVDNESSGKLLSKLGFKFDGIVTLGNDTEEIKLFSSGSD